MDSALRAELEHQLGVSLKLQRRHDEALSHLHAAEALAKPGRDLLLVRADVLQHMGRFDEAAAVYEALVVADPLDLGVHLLLNEIYHQRGHETEFLRSYDTALAHAPGAALLPMTKGRYLLRLNRTQEAQEAFRHALAIAPDDPAALAGLGRALEAGGDVTGASACYGKALAQGPDSYDVMEDYAGFLLRQQDFQKAEAVADKAHRMRPLSQGALGFLGLCYRARNNPREAWLNDYQDHVQVFDLEPPDGYCDMASFNRDLGAYLGGLHGEAREFFSQTARGGGTRLHDELFYNGHPLVDLLLPRLSAAIQTYAMRLKTRAGHPLVSRRAHGFRFSGSWSTRLNDNGFHVNHLHHKGWISSCYYVEVPDAAADPALQQGWIKFGEPAAEFGAAFTPRRTVQPLPGRLVLFPSYMWHGTIPFHSPQKRITIAFDALPA